jgi:hypothetical protein
MMNMRGNEPCDYLVGAVMQTRTIATFTLTLTCIACPLPDPDHESTSIASAESETTSDAPPDLPPDETAGTTETGDGDGDPGDTGDTGDGDPDETETGIPDLRWAVLDGNNVFVGWLASPLPMEIADHEDIFSGPVGDGFPREVYLTTVHEYAFWLVAAGPAYTTLGTAEAAVLFTEPGCNGLAHDRIASMPGDGGPVIEADCNDTAIDDYIAADELQMHYWPEQAFVDWQDMYWPGSLGRVLSTPALSHFYWLPTEQAWPEMLTAVSMRQPDGTCIELSLPVDACSLRLFDTIWEPLDHVGPYSLVEVEQ